MLSDPTQVRWTHWNPCDLEEACARRATLERIDQWWAAFTDWAQTSVAGQAQVGQDLTDNVHATRWIAEHLARVDRRLNWEIRPLAGRRCRLVISGEGCPKLRPLARAVVRRAPASLPGWRFAADRPPEPLPVAREMARLRSGLDPARMGFRLRRNRFAQIDLHLIPPRPGAEGLDADWLRSGRLFAAYCLGQRYAGRWLGRIRLAPEGSAGRGGLAMERFGAMFNALVRSVIEQQPRRPLWRSVAPEPTPTGSGPWAQGGPAQPTPQPQLQYQPQWMTLEPDAAPAARGWADQTWAITRHPNLWYATRQGEPFHGCRFSRCGEVFAYLRTLGPEQTDHQDQATQGPRGTLGQLNRALLAEGIGCVFGRGGGSRYSYADLALINAGEALKQARQIIQHLRFPHESWLMFHEADLINEWVGVYEDTPSP